MRPEEKKDGANKKKSQAQERKIEQLSGGKTNGAKYT